MSTLPQTDVRTSRTRNYHTIVRALATDGKSEKVAALVEQESYRIKEDYLARLKIKSDESELEAEAVRTAFVRRELPRYKKLLPRNDDPGRDVLQADRQREIDRIEAGLLKGLRNLKTRVEDYGSRFASDSLKATARAMSEMIQRLNQPSASVEEFIRVSASGVEVTASTGGKPSVEQKPWGSFTYLGARRAAYVIIEVDEDVPEEHYDAFGRAVRGVIGALVTGTSESGRTTVEDWLHDGEIAVIDAENFEKWRNDSQHLSICRAALLCTDAVTEILAAERCALEHGRIVLEQRSNALTKAAPPAPDPFLKKIDELCRGELERFLDYAARELEAAKADIVKKTRDSASKHVASMRDLGPVPNGAAPTRPGREIVCVQPDRVERVAAKAREDLELRCNRLCEKAAQLWHGGPDGPGRLIDGVVRPILAQNEVTDQRMIDALSNETFFTPLTPVTTVGLLNEHFGKLTQPGSAALIPSELPGDSRSMKNLFDRIGRMPNQLMAPFAGLFVLTSLLSLGNPRGGLKEFFSGFSFTTLLWMLGTLILVFGIASHIILRRERRAAEAVAIEKSRDGVTATVMQTVDAFTTAWLGVFRPNTLSSLKDLMRRAGKDLSLFHAKQHSGWNEQLAIVKRDRSLLESQYALVEALVRSTRESGKSIDGMQSELRKLLGKWEKEDGRAGRGAGGGA